MANNSTYAGLLSLAQETIDNLNLGPPTVIRKLPLKQEVIDPSTQIVVCPGESPEQFERLAFGKHYTYAPLVQVVIVAANNADESDTGLNTYLVWRESIAQALTDVSVGLASRLEYDTPLDRALVSDNYDYLSIGWRVTLWR